jgi:hypothetical protein
MTLEIHFGQQTYIPSAKPCKNFSADSGKHLTFSQFKKAFNPGTINVVTFENIPPMAADEYRRYYENSVYSVRLHLNERYLSYIIRNNGKDQMNFAWESSITAEFYDRFDFIDMENHIPRFSEARREK